MHGRLLAVVSAALSNLHRLISCVPLSLQYNPSSFKLILLFVNKICSRRLAKLNSLKFFFILFFLTATFVSFSSMNFSKPVDAKKTGKSCTYCHTKYGSKELTDAGKFYKDHGSLEGYKESK